MIELIENRDWDLIDDYYISKKDPSLIKEFVY